jgi:hypothetical protein
VRAPIIVGYVFCANSFFNFGIASPVTGVTLFRPPLSMATLVRRRKAEHDALGALTLTVALPRIRLRRDAVVMKTAQKKPFCSKSVLWQE